MKLDQYIAPPIDDGSKVLRLLPIDPKTRPFGRYREHHFQNRKVRCFRRYQRGRWVGDCPLCHVYQELWKAADRQGGGYLFAEPVDAHKLISEARKIKPIERFRFLAIERAAPSAGVKIFSTGTIVAEKVFEEILNSIPPIVEPPSHSRMRHLYIGMVDKVNHFLIKHGWKVQPDLEDWTPFSIQHGKDFLFKVNYRHGVGIRFPCYDESKFLERSPLGTPAQIKEWSQQAQELAQYLLIPFDNKESLWQKVVAAYPGFSIPFEVEEYDTVHAKKDLADWPYAEDL